MKERMMNKEDDEEECDRNRFSIMQQSSILNGRAGGELMESGNLKMYFPSMIAIYETKTLYSSIQMSITLMFNFFFNVYIKSRHFIYLSFLYFI